ncbi:MAG: hypothetical protein JWQ14_3040 [Adhaeribacter sp.]|nr:hypothetical protein [Adhaeribacter sp.]
MAKPACKNLEEIFRTPHGAVYQCNRANCFWLEFAGGISAFKASDFLHLKKQVEQIDVPEMVQNTARMADIVILNPFRSERCFVLTVTDVLNLRELLQGAKVMLDLNSMLYDCLHAMAV